MLNQRPFKVIDILSYIFLLLTAIAVPLFMDNRLVNFYIIPKQYVFFGLLLLSALAFAVKVVLAKKLEYRHSFLDWPLLFFLLIGLLSAIFSTAAYDSWLGRNEFFLISFVVLLFSVLYYFLLVNFVTTARRWRVFIDTLISVGGLSALLFALKEIFKLDALFAWFASATTTIDKINHPFGVWMIIVFILAAGQLIKKNLAVGRALFYFFTAILTLTALVLLSFPGLWWLLLGGLALLLLIGVNFIKEARLGWLTVLFALLVASAIFIAFGTPKALQSDLPPEVYLSFKPSWSIASDTVFSGVKNFLFGSGPGSFGVDFSRFRTVEFNADQLAWSLRFNQPFNTFLALWSEEGMLGLIAFLFVILLALGHALQAWLKNRTNSLFGSLADADGSQSALGLDVFLLSAAWILLTAAMGVTFLNSVLWWLWWTLLGLMVVGLGLVVNKTIKLKVWTVEDTPQYGLSFSFSLIVIIAAVVLSGIWGARLYLAETAYAQALRSSDLSVAEANLKQAIAYRSNFDIYHAALAQVYLLQAANASREEKPNLQTVSSYAALAVNEARAAADLSPRSVVLWENLATMYENAAAIVPEARDWAIKALTTARELEPSNPLLPGRLASIYASSEKWDDAVKNYEEGIKLKADYLPLYVGLAGVYERTDRLEQAIETFQKILPATYNNPDALFNYGRLLYNRNKKTDRADAETIWLRALEIQPNYSNALFSLGILNENRGDRATALEYYYKARDLNPENKEVAAKIRNLIGSTPEEEKKK